MAVQSCPACGTPNLPSSSSCGRCGRPLPAQERPPPSTRVEGIAPTFPPWFSGSASFPALRATDGPVVDDLQVFALLALFGSLIAYVVLFALFPGAGLPLGGLSSPASLTTTESALVLVVFMGSLGTALYLIGLRFAHRALARLQPLDSTFRTPANLTLLAILGGIFVLIAGWAAWAVLASAIGCAGSGGVPGGSGTTSCCNLGAGLTVDALAFMAAVLSVFGQIGMLVGFWRAGKRYDETTVRAGAVLLILPFLNVIGAVLMLIGLRNAAKRLR